MKNVILNVVTDGASGELGLVVEGLHLMSDEFMVATDGLLIAHDLLEHVNGIDKIGSIDDELEALGGVWYVRGQFGVLRQDNIGSAYSIEQNIAADVTNLGRYYVGRNINYRTPVPKTKAGDEEDAFKEIMRYGMRSLPTELESEDDYSRTRFNEYKETAIHYIRQGFRKARRKHKDAYKTNCQFFAIARAINEIIDDIQWEGQQFLLEYGNQRATCEEYYPGEMYG